MQPYFIQYPSTYPNYGTSQRPIVTSNNLVESNLGCSKEDEKNMKQDLKFLQPRWCPSGLSHTQKKKAATDSLEGVNGTISGGCDNEVSNHKESMAA